jgi:hypothetical protein
MMAISFAHSRRRQRPITAQVMDWTMGKSSAILRAMLATGLALSGCARDHARTADLDPHREHLARQGYGMPSPSAERYEQFLNAHPEGSDEAAQSQVFNSLLNGLLGNR